MLTLICVNTQIIQNKTAQINALETQRQELLDIQAKIEERIVKAKAKETIREYAQSQGMIESGK
jgi:low affinity Fe/Cu permease